jgi:hypothetical protein
MQLISSDGASVELRIAGYHYPDYYQAPSPEVIQRLGWANYPQVVSKWSFNWLQVSGNITPADGAAWAFANPCLTTWEARELGDWLREVAGGTVPPSTPGSLKFEGLMCFTEPNLSFDLTHRTADRVRIKAGFHQESSPPWFQPGQLLCPSNLLFLDVSVDEVGRAAESWMDDLAGFPEREQP